MDKLHSRLISDNNFEPREGQRDLLCSNNESLRCPSFGLQELKENIFSEEELENISGLCFILKKIRGRLISEGYSMENLRKQIYEQKTTR
ncbi:MAG: hypothetical protein WC870_03030 [Candidatus Paceibacterota bacterium]